MNQNRRRAFPVPSKSNKNERQIVGFLGVGLDGDGEHRVTRTEHFLLVGGSENTHGRMQDSAVKFNDALTRRGQPLQQLPVNEVIDLLREAHE
jgi:hypothetical protein